MALRVLQLGEFGKFIGRRESEWLEVKSMAYELKANSNKAAWKFEFAKDVAQFANSSTGGILILGFKTNNKDTGDVIEAMSLLVYDEKRVKRYRDVLKERIYPHITGLMVDEVVNDRGLCAVYAYVPAQADDNKPYLVTGAVIDGEFENAGITVPRRAGDSVAPATARELHAMIIAGKALLRDQQNRN
jgi:hypothetical protein